MVTAGSKHMCSSVLQQHRQGRGRYWGFLQAKTWPLDAPAPCHCCHQQNLKPPPLPHRFQEIHQSGFVHRDVKPSNLIFAEAERRFKLIDLGAAADLRTGINYVPEESILDPNYCPPEQVQGVTQRL